MGFSVTQAIEIQKMIEKASINADYVTILRSFLCYLENMK